MSLQSDSRKEYQSTYFVQDRSNKEERNRVQLQDNMITNAMSGVLPEQADPTIFRRVIDVGCGTGGWLIKTAKTYPDISFLVGIDISKQMVDYAREQAQAEQVDDRVEFQVMDTLRMIEFPQHSFDLVNQRFGVSYLRTWDWPNLLIKYQYATRPGGVIRITESDVFGTSTSPALTALYNLGRDAFYHAGHLFTPERDAVTNKLPEFFRNYGLKNVQTRTVSLKYHAGAGTEMMKSFFEDTKLLFHTIVPFLRKWGRIPDNYEEIYRQALDDIRQPDCLTTWNIVTVWGTNK